MKFNPTQEQETIVSTAKSGKNIVIRASAGAAKTTSCELVANEVNKPSLYIAFNKSIAEEAERRFPSHVICKTMHSLAYKAIIKYPASPLGKKLNGFYDWNDIDTSGVPKEGKIKFKFQVVERMKQFCQSATMSLEAFWTFLEQEEKTKLSPIFKTAVTKYWEDMGDSKSPVKLTHDVYLKLFQLSKPCLDYQVIYYDEFQDSNPVILDIVLRQNHAQIICVGDQYQGIYEWRGAVNALDKLPKSFSELTLGTSFRFHQGIADIATQLTSIAGSDLQIIGKGKQDDGVYDSEAVLCRTNNTILQYLYEAAEGGYKVYVLADLNPLWKQLYHLEALYKGERPKFPSAEMLVYNTWDDIQESLDEAVKLRKDEEPVPKELKDLEGLVRLFFALRKPSLYTAITSLKAAIADNPKYAKFTLATAHKSKGLEWDKVTLSEDMFNPKEDQSFVEALADNQAINLLYVAVTRAKKRLILPELVSIVVSDWESLKEEYAEYVL